MHVLARVMLENGDVILEETNERCACSSTAKIPEGVSAEFDSRHDRIPAGAIKCMRLRAHSAASRDARIESKRHVQQWGNDRLDKHHFLVLDQDMTLFFRFLSAFQERVKCSQSTSGIR